MIVINTVSGTKFSFNGVTYHKNFMPFVTGDKIAIINVYDACITLTDAPTHFSEYTVNGVTYTSVEILQASLLDVIYTRLSLGTISGTGTVTNVSLLLGSSGSDINGGVASPTTTPIITLNFPNASSINRGVLSSADWIIFNGKQDALGFTPYNATNPAGYITSASLAPLEFNTTDKTVWNNGGGNIDTNTSFGDEALKSNTTGTSNTAIGRAALSNNITGVANTALGWSAGGAANSNGSNSIFIGAASRPLGNTQTNQIAIGVNAVGLGSNTTVLGNVNTSFGRWWGNLLIGDSSNTGQLLQVTGNMKLTGTLTNGTFTYTLPSATGTLALTSALTGYVTLDTSQTITGAKFFTGFLTGLRASFESSGSSNTFAINHSSGSGIALNILKDGNGEALTIVKGSGSGNAASITGGITLLSELNLTTKLADAHIKSAATWNAKIGGTGTTNYIPKFTSANAIGNSQIFDNGTNVGIGTTSTVSTGGASRLFQIEGTTNFPGISVVRHTADSGAPNIVIGKSRATANGGVTIVQNGDDTGFLSFVGANGVNLNSYTAAIISQVDGTPSSTSMPGRLIFSTTAAGATTPTERLRITSTGNVGINTTSPNQLLSISSSAIAGSTFGLYNTFSNASNRNWALRLNASSFGDLGFLVSLSNGGNPESGSIAMLINRSGDVGINTTSPTSKLQVVGLPSYADNAAAISGGLTVGAFYHTAGTLKVVI
jgi:hypothetical protein